MYRTSSASAQGAAEPQNQLLSRKPKRSVLDVTTSLVPKFYFVQRTEIHEPTKTYSSTSTPFRISKEYLQSSREAKVAPYTSWNKVPPDPKMKIPLPVEASFNNPLGIRPSSSVSRNARFTPTGPKALSSVSTPVASTSKKKLVIGSTWALGKANLTLDKAASWPESERVSVPCSAKRKDRPALPPPTTHPPSPPHSQPVLAPAPPIKPIKASPLMTSKSPEIGKIDRSKWKKLSETRPEASSSLPTTNTQAAGNVRLIVPFIFLIAVHRVEERYTIINLPSEKRISFTENSRVQMFS